MRNEAMVLQTLAASHDANAIAPFVPRLLESFAYAAAGTLPRQANLLAYDPRAGDPRGFYSLAEVRAAYPAGLDARDAAWMFRRVLHALSLIHANDLAHGAVVPNHILIEPNHHQLILIGWTSAQPFAARWRSGSDAIAKRWISISSESAGDADLILAAKTFVELVGGDPQSMTMPPTCEPAIARFFERCVAGRDVSGSRTALKLLADFDRLIEALWGPRTFRPFAMPRRARAH